MRILWLDDSIAEDQDLRDVYDAQFSDAQIDYVGNAESALQLFRGNGPYDLIVTDYDHPGIDGVQFCAEIQNANPIQPVVMCTIGMPQDAIRTLQAMNIPIVSKWLQPLRSRFEEILSARRK